MHPTIHQQVAQARIADLHQQARLNCLVHEAVPARRAQPGHPPRARRRHRSALARRVLVVLRARTTPARS